MLINASGRGIVDSSFDLLWENSNPTSAFAAQTINLDISEYKTLYMLCVIATSHIYLSVYTLINDGVASVQYIDVHGGTMLCRRTVTLNDSSITFTTGTCIQINNDTGVVTSTTGTQYAVPYRIYGRKRLEV